MIQRTSGFTLIELMIAMSVSALTIVAAGRLYGHAAATYRAIRAEQSVTDAAQLALSAIRSDIEHVSNFDRNAAITVDAREVRNDCGSQWATAISQAIEVSNNTYGFVCPAYAHSPMPQSDTLTLRSIAAQSTRKPEPGRIYAQPLSNGGIRLFAATDERAFFSGELTLPRVLTTRAWYVSNTSAASTIQQRIPSLRIKHLAVRNTQPTVVDEEVQAGVEDLQVELLTRPDETISMIRVWLLVRSMIREPGLTMEIPAYADRNSQSFADGFRRRLVSASIALTDDQPL